VIEHILPPEIIWSERVGSINTAPLLEPEAAALGDVVDRRRKDFAMGRECAHEALRAFGLNSEPILIGEGGEPIWPHGFVGSITHTREYVAAVVGRLADFQNIGIDAEIHRPMREGTLELIASDDERSMIQELPRGTCWDMVLFSIKESIYKAEYPLGQRLGWSDIRVAILPDTHVVNVLKPKKAEARYFVQNDLVLTCFFSKTR
jgi:4'-phosphopantetheinyl transferase EntD